MVLHEEVVEERPVGLTLDVLSSLAEGDGSGVGLLLLEGTVTEPGSPVEESLLQHRHLASAEGLQERVLSLITCAKTLLLKCSFQWYPC